LNNEENKDPKILITTTDITISSKTYKLCRELEKVLPNAQYFYRKNVTLKKIIPEAIKRDYSAILVINQDRKEPSKRVK
jgi:ribosome production factor 1